MHFLLSRVFWKNVLYAVLVTFVLVTLVQVSLRFYTGHGKKIRIPDFTGMTLTQVDRLCEQNKILWLIQDSNYVKEAPRGTVLDQFPAAGSYVKKNRKIFLITNSWSPEIIRMPKAFDMPYRQAERVLQTAGLKVERTEFVPYFAPTYVIEQKFEGRTIPEGSPIESGSGITLVIGRGLSEERSPVPDLLSIGKETARSIAMSYYFYLGAVIYDSTVTNAQDSLVAKIYRQYPTAGHPARLGTSVDVWLTLDSLRLIQADSLQMAADTLNW